MTISKISANVVQNMGLGTTAEPKATEVSAEPKKDSKKVLMWALGGLAVAGAAGVLIYNARKGKTTGGSSASGAAAAAGGSFSLGAFAKKFADESIFAKTIENVKNKVAGIEYTVENGKWRLNNTSEKFSCNLVKLDKPTEQGFTSYFDFDSAEMVLQVLNHKDNKTIFNISAQGHGFTLVADSANGKLVTDMADGGKSQKLIDDLDLAKLIDDAEYRKNYCKSVNDFIKEGVDEQDMEALAEKTGKTIDELNVSKESAEFQNYWRSMAQLQTDIIGVNNGLKRFEELFNVPESLNIQKIFGFVEGKHETHFLEDFLSGNKAFEYSVNKIEDGSGLIPRQTVAEIRDLSVHNEKLTLGDGANGDYIAYEKFNEDMTEFVNIRYYNPAELKDKNARVTQILTKDLSLDMEETAAGIQSLSIRRDGKEIADSEKDTLMTLLKDESMRATFVKDFVTRGKEMLENYLK